MMNHRTQTHFIIYPLSEKVTAELKATMRDQFGNEPQLEEAQF